MKSSNGHFRSRGEGPESSVEKREGRAPAPEGAGTDGQASYEDPWQDALTPGWGELDGTGAPAPDVPHMRTEQEGTGRVADVYLEVQRSEAFREVRRRYRRFVVPGFAVFFTWYVGYVVAAQTAPGLMARPVAGSVNVAMLAGLGQFLTTFLLTWAYARHARLRRDRAALDLRWDTQELTRGLRGGER
ncbi:DUF485 domain-containing protein [Streptomyces gibsoniae]|uniref:DUF485 domain-containing protein n=1 Tax=Streptomyces gibsoniae TaxID=3075529 RepID=A0ABU2TMI9_9ACTN|nr:DUF485 domain-containing protein [Streptomyces sp. DSM 41699]MDT0462154.1 DUF485 domain-containing protein [Streptomyces sp. DSM 41699]